MVVTVWLAALTVLIQGCAAQNTKIIIKDPHAASDTRSSLGALQAIFSSLAGNVQVSVSTQTVGRPNHGLRPNKYTSSSCIYWCRTPENSFYCCGQPTTHRPDKPGCCPKVRPNCPRLGPPVPCTHDFDCANAADKCCFDRCLEQHVCKPARPCFG
ncbi:uncharacterized protein LOC121864219 [Homarus americanus]|uniref:uncharacterized protein LOC121864219 n=1 Tax=Homarus americanus TaxID=6706 RepID=UPI001C4687E0|nr:uncharacterized protein LOC121864219 [Homarus americanus]